MWVWKACRPLEGLPGGLVQILHDGDGALALSDHETSHRRSKNIHIGFRSARDGVGCGDVPLGCVSSNENAADQRLRANVNFCSYAARWSLCPGCDVLTSPGEGVAHVDVPWNIQ
jgi:hypothetical protein